MQVLFGEHRSPTTDAIVKDLLRQRITPIFHWRSQTPDAERRGQPQRIVQPGNVDHRTIAKEQFLVFAKKLCPYSQRAAQLLNGATANVKWASSRDEMDKLRRQYTDITGKPFSTWPRVFNKTTDDGRWHEIGGCNDLEEHLQKK